MNDIASVVFAIVLLAFAAVLYLHWFVWPAMVSQVAADNQRIIDDMAKELGPVEWWFRARSLRTGAASAIMEVGAWQRDLPEIAKRLRGCTIASPSHVKWRDVDIRLHDVADGFVVCDRQRVYPAESMLPIGADHMPRHAAQMIQVLLPGQAWPHESIMMMYRTMVQQPPMEKDAAMPAQPL